MKKSDLKYGYLIKTRNNHFYIVMPSLSGDVLTNGRYTTPMALYDEELNEITSIKYSNSCLDIVEVYGFSVKSEHSMSLDPETRPLLWTRPTPEKPPAPYNISINDFAKEVHENAVAHGFYDDYDADDEFPFTTTISLCHAELSEALEQYRNGEPNVYFFDENDIIATDLNLYNGQKLEGKAVELIDCVLRILDWCGRENIDVEWLLAKKHEYNKTRPYKHGGKII